MKSRAKPTSVARSGPKKRVIPPGFSRAQRRRAPPPGLPREISTKSCAIRSSGVSRASVASTQATSVASSPNGGAVRSTATIASPLQP